MRAPLPLHVNLKLHVALLKFIFFEEEALHFCFVWGATCYVADPAYMSVFLLELSYWREGIVIFPGPVQHMLHGLIVSWKAESFDYSSYNLIIHYYFVSSFEQTLLFFKLKSVSKWFNQCILSISVMSLECFGY